MKNPLLMPHSFRKWVQDQEAKDASHLSQSAPQLSLDKTESFSAWLDAKGDALADPTSFDEWLRQSEDSI